MLKDAHANSVDTRASTLFARRLYAHWRVRQATKCIGQKIRNLIANLSNRDSVMYAAV